MQDKGLEYDIWLLGEGARHKKELESLLAAQNVKNVRFLGFNANPYCVMRACDCVVLASEFEGFGLVVCEACVLQKPVIASDIAAHKEVLGLESGEICGLLFENKNAINLAECMEKMLQDGALRANLANRATQISQKFSLEKSGREFVRAITEF